MTDMCTKENEWMPVCADLKLKTLTDAGTRFFKDNLLTGSKPTDELLLLTGSDGTHVEEFEDIGNGTYGTNIAPTKNKTSISLNTFIDEPRLS